MTATPTLPEMCAALGDQTRWDILTRLGQETMSASALARVLPVSRQAIVKHLDVLSDAGLVTAERRGREIVYAALGSRLNALAHELDRIGNAWDTRLRTLKSLAESPDGGSTPV